METAVVSSCIGDYDITTCTICLEQFSIPKYLPCLHTFCESCIGTYITSAFEKDKTYIDCPVCRAKCSTPEENITPQEWAKQMPLNFLIVGLIEKHKVERKEKICMSCERFDVNTKSEASSVCIDCSDTLCANCTRCHKSNKLCSNHEIVPILDISKEGHVLKSFKNMCPEHKNKELELFCVDHDFPCCSICVSVKHRKCESVLTIEEAAKNFRASNSVRKTQNEVSSLLADFDTVLESERSLLVDMKASHDDEIQTCTLFWQNLQQRIEELKNKSIKECQKVFSSEKSKLECTIRDVENRKKEVTNTKQILEVTLKEASDVQLMIEVQKLNKNIDKQLRNIETSVETYRIKIHFQRCLDDIVKIFEDNVVVNNEKSAKEFDLSSSKFVNKGMKPESLDDHSNDKEIHGGYYPPFQGGIGNHLPIFHGGIGNHHPTFQRGIRSNLPTVQRGIGNHVPTFHGVPSSNLPTLQRGIRNDLPTFHGVSGSDLPTFHGVPGSDLPTLQRGIGYDLPTFPGGISSDFPPYHGEIESDNPHLH